MIWSVLLGAALVGVMAGLSILWLSGSFGGREAHYPSTDLDDPVAVAVRDAHVRLNSAVGWDEWRPDHLKGLSRELREAAALREPGPDPLRSVLLEAADAVDHALADDDRDEARFAHRLVEDAEYRLAADHRARRGS